MKKIFLVIVAGLIISAATPTMAQHHRHTPNASMKMSTQTDKDGNTKNTTAIVAFSDTTDTEAADSLDEDSLSDADTYGWSTSDDLDSIGKMLNNTLLPIAIVFIMFCLAPVLIIGLIIYFIIKTRKQKIQLAELAIKNGQPIPQDIVKSNKDIVKSNKVPNDQELWAKGIKKIFIGLGIFVLAVFIHSGALKGIGFLVLFYGAGQAVIAWTTKNKILDSSQETTEGPTASTDTAPLGTQDGKNTDNKPESGSALNNERSFGNDAEKEDKI